MVNDYAGSVVLARALHVKLPVVEDALRRLDWYSGYLGRQTMRSFIERAPDPLHPGQMLVYWEGEFDVGPNAPRALPDPPATGRPAPSPVVP